MTKVVVPASLANALGPSRYRCDGCAGDAPEGTVVRLEHDDIGGITIEFAQDRHVCDGCLVRLIREGKIIRR